MGRSKEECLWDQVGPVPLFSLWALHDQVLSKHNLCFIIHRTFPRASIFSLIESTFFPCVCKHQKMEGKTLATIRHQLPKSIHFKPIYHQKHTFNNCNLAKCVLNPNQPNQFSDSSTLTMRLPLTQSLLPHKPGVHQELNFLNPKRSQVTVRYVLNPNQLKNKHQLHQHRNTSTLTNQLRQSLCYLTNVETTRILILTKVKDSIWPRECALNPNYPNQFTDWSTSTIRLLLTQSMLPQKPRVRRKFNLFNSKFPGVNSGTYPGP